MTAKTKAALLAAGRMCVAMDRAIAAVQLGRDWGRPNWLDLATALGDLWAARREYDAAIVEMGFVRAKKGGAR